MDLIETNRLINMTTDHCVSNNNLLKAFWKVKCTYQGDVNSASGENWKEPLSSTVSIKAPFNGDCNANKT